MADQPHKTYEGMFLFGTSHTSDVDGATSLVRSMIEKAGGKAHVLKKWDDRKLAYPVKKQTRGLYVLTYFEAPGTAVAAIVREVNLGEDVLRVLITDAAHLSAEEVDAHVPQKPAPRKKPEDEDDGYAPRGSADTDADDDGEEAEAETADEQETAAAN